MNKIEGYSKFIKYFCEECKKEMLYISVRNGAKRCRKCYLKNPDKGYSHNFSETELNRRAALMTKNRKNGKINSDWIKGNSRWEMHPNAILKMKGKLKGRRLNKSGEFKKGTVNGLKKRGHLINKHHIDLNHNNDIPCNRLYLIDGMHQRIHRSAYNYLVKIGLITPYIKWFIDQYKPKIYTVKDYIKQTKGDSDGK